MGAVARSPHHAGVVKFPQSGGDRDPLRPQDRELRVNGEQLLDDR